VTLTFPSYYYLTSTLNLLSTGDLVVGTCDGSNGNITIFNLANGEMRKSFQAHIHPIYSIIEWNGNLISASYQDIKVWATNDQNIQTISAHSKEVMILLLLPNNDLLSASLDNSIKSWSTLDWTLKRTYNIHSQYITALILLKNGDVASSSWDYTVKIWNPSDGTVKLTLNGFVASALTLFSNSDLLTGTYANIFIWNSANGDKKSEWPQPNKSVLSMSVSSNDDLIVGSYGEINIHNNLDGSIKKTFSNLDGNPDYLVMLQNGNLAYASSVGRKITILKG